MSGRFLTDSEIVTVGHDRRTGVKAVIVIDDTTLGPGLGGVRWMSYPSTDDAVIEAQRLAVGMTLKHAVAGLPFGGGKSVIFATGTDDRVAVMHGFARIVARLGGLYIPGVDMGTDVEDLAVIGCSVEVTCDKEDPSPATALGVYHAARAAVRTIFDSDLSGRTVTIQGVGHVGSALASMMAGDGAKVLVADMDPARAEAVAAAVGADVLDVEEVLTTVSDVLVPCAAARVINLMNIEHLGARIVVGAANDVIASRDCAEMLAARGVTYVPDFVANAGGVIHIQSARAGWKDDRLEKALNAIGTRVTELLKRSESAGITPLEAAEQLASERVDRRVTLPS